MDQKERWTKAKWSEAEKNIAIHDSQINTIEMDKLMEIDLAVVLFYTHIVYDTAEKACVCDTWCVVAKICSVSSLCHSIGSCVSFMLVILVRFQYFDDSVDFIWNFSTWAVAAALSSIHI